MILCRPANKANTVCKGKKDSEGRSCSCTPSIKNCHTCSTDSDGAPSKCTKCKNGKALLSGECVNGARCVDKGGVVKGTGNFGRVCAIGVGLAGSSSYYNGAPIAKGPKMCKGTKDDLGGKCSCSKVISGCHTCTLTGDGSPDQCSQCKNRKALLANACVSTKACESKGGSIKGKGNFGRACEGVASGTADHEALVPN